MSKDSNERFVAFLSDFGNQDSYVYEMHSAVLKECQSVILLDITHQIPRGDINSAAYVLWRAVMQSPQNTIFVCVVDPGVGTNRQPVVVSNAGNVFTGPDNGIFSRCLDWDKDISTIIINPKELDNHAPSNTFHGRDIFAKAAGMLAAGKPLEQLGDTGQLKATKPFEMASVSNGTYRGKVVYIDVYGNTATNIPNQLDGTVSYKNSRLGFFPTYGAAPDDTAFWLSGSDGFIEIAVKGKSAAEMFNAQIQDEVCFEPA